MEDDLTSSGKKPQSSALERYIAPTTLDTRWLWMAVVCVPVIIGASVYWLHHQESGPKSQSAGPIVEVRLVQEADLEPIRELVRAQPKASDGVSEPLMEAPDRPIPEETTSVSAGAATTLPAPATNDASVTAIAKPQPVTSGLTSEFRRQLLAHIARFRPKAAFPGQHGVAQVMFSMNRNGTVADVWVRRSSGYLPLDEAAAETIRRSQPLPNIPADMPERMTITIPISFDPV